MANSPTASTRDPPTRTMSESDTTDSLSTDEDIQPLPSLPHVSSFTFGHKKRNKLVGDRNVKKKWVFAAQKSKNLKDPWEALGMDNLLEEFVIRHMYSPRVKKWKVDEVVVKIQSESFAHGAMRECFRMKKLSKFSQHPDWKNASNYVAKRYINEVTKETYFGDVKLQMDSKLWGEEYNKLEAVPKKVDFFQTYVIEFKGREGSPLYCVEHFIEGGYVKYNSNSGFVSDVNRLTPQAFSHFTFEKSNHKLILVDIQGVGDLYTDPQMHTVDQKEYGEANLGIRGMALYFSSHICSPLCKSLGLTQFDLSEKEIDNLLSKRWSFSSSTTKVFSLNNISVSSHDVQVEDSSLDVSASKQKCDSSEKETVEQAFRRLSTGLLKSPKHTSGLDLGSIPESPLPVDSPFGLDSPLLFSGGDFTTKNGSDDDKDGGIVIKVDPALQSNDSLTYDEQCLECCPIRVDKLDTYPIESDNYENDDSHQISLEAYGKAKQEGDVLKLGDSISNDARYLNPPGMLQSASVVKERTRIDEGKCETLGTNETDVLRILGKIHLDLAKCHEAGRFASEQSPIDNDIIKFHLDKAANCGNILALYTLAHIYLQRSHEDFPDISVEPSPRHEAKGMDYLVGAAERGLRPAVFEVAKAYDTGAGLGSPAADGDQRRTQSWSEAVAWYYKLLQPQVSSSTSTTDSLALVDPDYLLLARLAELYRSGGHGLVPDIQKSGDLYTEAAEAAMSAMKGKLSNKYYMLAEEVWGEMED